MNSRFIHLAHMWLRVDIDREHNLKIDMSFLQLMIEDVQTELPIAPSFRVSLVANQLIETAVRTIGIP
jgi:hypothetical protein